MVVKALMNMRWFGIAKRCVAGLLALAFVLVSGPMFYCVCANKVVAVQDLVAGSDCCPLQSAGKTGAGDHPCSKSCFESWTLGYLAKSDASSRLIQPDKPTVFNPPPFLLSGGLDDIPRMETHPNDFTPGRHAAPDSLPLFLRFRVLLI